MGGCVVTTVDTESNLRDYNKLRACVRNSSRIDATNHSGVGHNRGVGNGDEGKNEWCGDCRWFILFQSQRRDMVWN